jgi:superfamily I DNA/RNA helicase
VAAGVKLWAVGDDDQTLYAFRAADVRFILDFAHKYRDVQVHVIDSNYRPPDLIDFSMTPNRRCIWIFVRHAT